MIVLPLRPSCFHIFYSVYIIYLDAHVLVILKMKNEAKCEIPKYLRVQERDREVNDLFLKDTASQTVGCDPLGIRKTLS